MPITPMDRTGASVDCFPVHPAFPVVPAGRHPYLHFRGLLRLHSRYGPLDRSTAQRRPLSRGSGPASRPAKPLVSYQINRQFSGWNLPPLVSLLQNSIFRGPKRNRCANGRESKGEPCSILQEPLVIRAFGAHRTDMEHTERYFQKIATTWKIVLHTFDNFAENCAIFLSPTGC